MWKFDSCICACFCKRVIKFWNREDHNTYTCNRVKTCLGETEYICKLIKPANNKLIFVSFYIFTLYFCGVG